MKELTIGIKGTAAVKAAHGNLAADMESGALEVFATPAMVALMEKAACDCLKEYIEDGETTVGTEISVSHISATPAGLDVTAEAVLTAVNGREFSFEVTASDNAGVIGKGTHKRFLVYSGKFMAKTKAKLENV